MIKHPENIENDEEKNRIFEAMNDLKEKEIDNCSDFGRGTTIENKCIELAEKVKIYAPNCPRKKN